MVRFGLPFPDFFRETPVDTGVRNLVLFRANLGSPRFFLSVRSAHPGTPFRVDIIFSFFSICPPGFPPVRLFDPWFLRSPPLQIEADDDAPLCFFFFLPLFLLRFHPSTRPPPCRGVKSIHGFRFCFFFAAFLLVFSSRPKLSLGC